MFYVVFFRMGAKSVADIDTGDQNPYFSTKSQCYHCSSCPGGEPNSIANFLQVLWLENELRQSLKFNNQIIKV